MIVALTTDILVWGLVVAITAYFVHVRRQPHLREPWRRVTQSTSGMSALLERRRRREKKFKAEIS